MTLAQLKKSIASETSKQTLSLLEEYFTDDIGTDLLMEGSVDFTTTQHNISNNCDDEINIEISGYTSGRFDFGLDVCSITKKVMTEGTGDFIEGEFHHE